ncbi:MAG: hypothetical protein ACM3Q2_08955 [Syntrophothermus sp.]
MISKKRFLIYTALVMAAITPIRMKAQTTGGIYLDPNRGEKIYRKTVIMNSNRAESILGNWGIFGKQDDKYSGVWPKGTGHGHVHEMTMMAAAEVTDTTGKIVHIFSQSYGGTNTGPDGTQYWWNPLPGYANEHRRFTKADGTFDTTAQVAHSADRTTWPSSWPGLNSTWNGTWNGYFGQNQFSADDEAVYVTDDYTNKKFGYFPFASERARQGLGLQCETRLFQWSHPLAQDLIFIHFQITNMSDNIYNNNIYFGAFADTHPGGLGSSNDEDSYSLPDNMVYAWAHNNIGIWTSYRDVKPGYMAWKYLESPGNPEDGNDNNANGIVDEKRDNDAGTKYEGRDNIVNALSTRMDLTKFMAVYGYGSPDEIPAVHAGIWWTGDENANWDIKTDDVGADGIGPDDPNYKNPDADGTEGNGKPDQGEPNFGKTDKNESDQIGLTSFYSPLYGTFSIGQDEQAWAFIQPGVFQTPAQNANNLWVFASGPFDLKIKKTERFSVVWVFAADESGIFNNARIAQVIYDNNYRFTKPPSQPILKAVPGDKRVTLYWDNRAENSKDPIYGYDFEGYKLFRGTDPQLSEAQVITDAFGNKTYNQPIAQFDLADNIKGLHPVTLGSETGDGSHSIGIKYYMGSDNGLKYSYTDTTVKNGFTYYYALVSYDKGYFNGEDNNGMGLDTLLGIPSRRLGKMSPSESPFSFTFNTGVLLSQSPNTAIVTPRSTATNYKAGYIKEADKNGYILAKSSNVESTGRIQAEVVDADVLPKDNYYEISFVDTVGTSGETVLKGYTITNVTPGKDSVLISRAAIPVELNTGKQSLKWPSPAVEGMKFNFENLAPDLTKIKALSDWTSDTKTNLIVSISQLSSSIVAKNFAIEVTDTLAHKDTKGNQVYFKVYDRVTKLPVDFLLYKDGNQKHIGPGTQIVFPEKISGGSTANSWRISFSLPAGDLVSPQKGDKYEFFSDVPFNRNTKFQFSSVASTTKAGESDLLNMIKVVPNPYIISAKWEKASVLQGRGERKIYFTHLPAECTIRLFTQNGTLIKTLQHSGSVSDGTESWDLTTSEGLEVAFGIYVYQIDSPGLGQKIGTLGIIN